MQSTTYKRTWTTLSEAPTELPAETSARLLEVESQYSDDTDNHLTVDHLTDADESWVDVQEELDQTLDQSLSQATMPSAVTLQAQISTSQPRRCHSGFFPSVSVMTVS